LLHRRQGDEPIGLQRQRHVLEGREVRVTAASATSSSQRLEIGAYVEQFFGASIGMSLQYFDF
jgi:hypothetical protein